MKEDKDVLEMRKVKEQIAKDFDYDVEKYVNYIMRIEARMEYKGCKFANSPDTNFSDSDDAKKSKKLASPKHKKLAKPITH